MTEHDDSSTRCQVSNNCIGQRVRPVVAQILSTPTSMGVGEDVERRRVAHVQRVQRNLLVVDRVVPQHVREEGVDAARGAEDGLR